MKKPTKKQGIIIAGIAVIIICASGWMMMDHGDKENIPKINAVVINDVKPIIDKIVKDREQDEKEKQEKKEEEQKQKEEVEQQQEAPKKEVTQSIAPEPEVPAEETVQTPPVQQQTPPSTENNGNSNESHEGMIWVPGFGWVEDEGGGSEGEDAPDMVPNGNQIGEMN